MKINVINLIVYLFPVFLIGQGIKSVINPINQKDYTEINQNSNSACVVWLDSPPNEQKYINATEYLCNKNIISNLQFSSLLSAQLNLEDCAILWYNSLYYQKNFKSYVDNFPSPFVDLDSLTLEEFHAINALLYLEYLDGISCISRDYYLLGTKSKIARGKAIKALLEAWNISPNWNGYDENSNANSWFLCDVKVNDPYYGYMQTAYQTGVLQEVLHSGCGCNQRCYASGQSITLGEAYLIMYRLMLAVGGNPPQIIDSVDYFVPNSFKLTNVSNIKGIDRGIFEHYSDLSFNIPGGGLPLVFSHSFHSNLSELPSLAYETSFPKVDKLWKSALFPLGENWTHNYNIYILSIKTTNFKDKRLIINWGDGSIQSYDSEKKEYETKGIYDKLTIDSADGQGNGLKVRILKPDGTKFYFRRHLEEMQVLQLEKIEDRNLNSISLNYEAGYEIVPYHSVRLRSVKDNVSQRSLTLNYKSNSNDLISVVDNGGRIIRYEIDPNSHLLLNFKDQNQLQTNYFYGFNASDKMLLTEIQLPKGNKIKNSYFQRKLKSTTNDQYEIKVKWHHDYLNQNYIGSFSTLTVSKNSNEYSTSITHDQFGNQKLIINPDGTSVIYEYGNQSHPFTPTKVTDNNLGLIKESYLLDQYGNPKSINIYKFGFPGISHSYWSEYNDFNQLTLLRLPEANETKYEYSSTGNLLKVTYPDNTISSYIYNSNGNPISMVNPSGIKTLYGYNSFGNLQSIEIEGTGIKTSAVYDNYSRITSITDPKGIRQIYEYDLADNILNSVYDPSGLNYKTQYQYDNNYNLTKIISPRGLSTTLNYDYNTDDLVQEIHGSFKTKDWAYNKDGSIKSFTNKAGFTFTNSFAPSGDPFAGKLISDGYNDYEYSTPIKRLSKVKHSGVDVSYVGFDNFNRSTSIATQISGTISDGVKYEYSKNDRITRITYPSNGRYFDYVYDALDRLIYIKDWKDRTLVQYSYLADSRLSKEQFLNGIRTEYKYDNAGRLTNIITFKSNNDTITSNGAILDLNGNHTSEFLKMNLLGNYTANPVSSVINYSYKNNENILTTSFGNESNTYQYNNNNALTSISGTSGSVSLEWDQMDKLIRYVNLDSNKIIDFKYDGYGNRRIVGNTRYALDILNGSNVLEETDLTGKVKSVYVHGLGLVCRIDPITDDVSFYHSDFRGSTQAITDINQNITHQYVYDEYGKVKWDTTIGFYNPFQFVGRYGIMKDETGLYYMRARYYNPGLGRFISEDPVWGTNLYPYADNNPINKIDPSGNLPSYQELISNINSNVDEGNHLQAFLGIVAAIGYKAAEFASYGIDVKVPRASNSNTQFTRSSLKVGQEIHKSYKVNLHNGVTKFKEYRLPSGNRIDFIDFESKTIYELKPNNPRQKELGNKQLEIYKKEIESIYGKGWKTILETY